VSARQMVRSASIRLQPMPRVSDAPWLLRLPIRAWRALLAAYTRWEIWETESHLRACAEDGLTDSLNLRMWHADLQSLRIRLIDLTTRD